MGNAESAVVRNVDKRTSRREHRPTFEAAVRRFRAAPFAAPVQEKARASALGRSVRVCVRKRPIFPHETDQQGEFDVITCSPGRVVVHDARMHPDMIHMFMNHHDFVFDEAFGENADNDMVYQGTTHDLVLDVLRGGSATCMMYGQTGSGKTFTMTAIYERAASELFANVNGRLVTMCFVELLGDHCFDMFNQGAPCTLSTAADGSVHPYPSVEVPVGDAREFIALIELATKLRATAATGVHDQSSRSHALCRIFVDGPGTGEHGDSEGCLTLVDLAGSEHRIDNAEHNAERRKEGAKINASLAALKECIRATAAGAKFVAFRQNRLTQLLRGCFVGADRHQTVVIATISPSSKDTEHSLNTLRHACIMDGQGESKSGQSAHLAGGAVTKELLGEIDVAKIARERRASRKTEAPNKDEWGKPPPAHQAKQSNTGARAQLDAKCVRALPPRVGQALLEARRVFGTDRQRIRLTRAPPDAAVADAAGDENVGATRPSHCEADSTDRSSSPVRSRPRPVPPQRPVPGEMAEPPVHAATLERAEEASSADGDELQDAMGEGAADHEKALALFRCFCVRGREAKAWRKNDLRLINTFVVPLLYGKGTQLDWAHPNVALDELERLVAESPPPPHLAGTSSSSAAPPPERATQRERLPTGGAESSSSRPARPPALPGSAPETRTRHSIGAPPGDRPRSGMSEPRSRDRSAPLMRSGSTTPDQRRSLGHVVPSHPRAGNGTQDSRQAAARSPVSHTGMSGNTSARSMSPMRRGSDEGPDVRGPITHHDAIRARREALEQQRQATLQRALNKPGKMGSMSRDEEIATLEQQLGSSTCSAAAAVGLKKRLATLRAAALREQRAKKWSVPDRTLPDVVEGKPPSPPIQTGAALDDSDAMPAPARPPPRQLQASNAEPAVADRELRPSGEWTPGSPVRGSIADDRRATSPLEDREHRSRGSPGGVTDGFHQSMAGGVGQRCVPARTSTGRRRAPAPLQIGAASAPWANELSNVDGVTAQA